MAEVDIGDPDVILPISDMYSLAVIVSGRNIKQNIFWVFSDFQITFNSQARTTAATDIDYLAKTPIEFTFPEKPIPPPVHFTGFFVLLLVLSGVAFIFILKSIGSNTSRLPKSQFKKLVVFAFIILYILSFWLLFYFWIEINFIQTLKIIAYAALPFLFLAN